MKKMEKLFNWISIVFGMAGGFLTYWMGGWDVLLKTIVFLAIADYITGWIKGIYTKQLSSEIGFRGLLKKIVMFIVIAQLISAYLIELLGMFGVEKEPFSVRKLVGMAVAVIGVIVFKM